MQVIITLYSLSFVLVIASETTSKTFKNNELKCYI